MASSRKNSLLFLALLVVVVGGFLYATKEEDTALPGGKRAQKQTVYVQEIPEVNPYAGRANPFADTHVNPFTDIYRNPFE